MEADATERGDSGSRMWYSEFLAANESDGPRLVAQLAPFVEWIGDHDPLKVTGDHAYQLVRHWRGRMGANRAAEYAAGMSRLYAYFVQRGERVDASVLPTLMSVRSLLEAEAVPDRPPPTPLREPFPSAVEIPQGKRTVGWPVLASLVNDRGGRVLPGTADAFNWGAFFWGSVWAVFNGQPALGVLGLVLWPVLAVITYGVSIPILFVVEGFYFGTYGNVLTQVAQPGRWQSAEQLLQSGRRWAWSILLLVLFGCALAPFL